MKVQSQNIIKKNDSVLTLLYEYSPGQRIHTAFPTLNKIVSQKMFQK